MNKTTVEHPDWCDPDRCTVTPAAAAGEAHQGSPVTVVAGHGIAVPLGVTASLYQPAAWPMAGPFVTLEVHGLDGDGLRSVAGTTQVAAEHAATLGSILLDVGDQLFFEIVQRTGGYQGYGAASGATGMAAQR